MNIKNKLIYLFAVFLAIQLSAQLVVEDKTTTGNGMFTVPAGVTKIKVEAWGGGGGGSNKTSNYGGGGGGGGAYAASVLTVTPGNTYNYTVGAGGSGAAANKNGGNSIFGANSVVAAGGTGGGVNSTTLGAGGAVANSTGDDRYAGGNGGTGAGTNGGFSGSGGGAAGTTSNGTNGSASATGGAAGSGYPFDSPNTGIGGAGRNNAGVGNPGILYGGGGGGAYNNNNAGGAGGNGSIRISYLPEITGNTYITIGGTSQLSNTVAGGTWTSDNTSVATVNGSTGVVSGVAAGTAVITYTASDGLARTITVSVGKIYEIKTTTGNGTFIVPAGVTAIRVEAWGAGGGGGAITNATARRGGGGGGAYAAGNIAVTPGSTYTYSVGAGGASAAAGNPSWFRIPAGSNTAPANDTQGVLAAGGSGGTTNSTAAGAGGTTAASYIPTGGDEYAGGAGGAGGTNYSGGGGGVAGTTAAATAAPSNNTGTAGAAGAGYPFTSPETGAGGAGRNSTGTGAVGNPFGGGGAGATTTSNTTAAGGVGGNGAVRISYLPEITGITSITTIGGTTQLSNAAAGGTWSSSATGIATVNSSTGLVTGVAIGTAVITYTADGLTRTVTIAVNKLWGSGSRDLYPEAGATGNRALLISRRCPDCAFDPFPTLGRHFVYAKQGETIYVGSSVQGMDNGRIYLYAPNGATYNSGNSTSVGRISNRAQELAGPYTATNAGGYTPYTRTVGAGEEGVWVVEFWSRAANHLGTTGSTAMKANASWVDTDQTGILSGSTAFIIAWDVTVGSTADAKVFVLGRTYTTLFAGGMGASTGSTDPDGFYGKLYALTKDGFVFQVDNNGQNGLSFNTFVNNKGLIDTNGNPTYLSATANTAALYREKFYDPRKFDDSNNFITHKMFYGKPDSGMPPTAPIWNATPTSPPSAETADTAPYWPSTWRGVADAASVVGGDTTWLRPVRQNPDLQTLTFVGVEGTENTAGIKGGYFVFNSHVIGDYKITIPINAPGVNRVLTGDLVAGENRILWNGLDGAGNPGINGVNLSNITVDIHGAEIHFPFLDVENNPYGITVQRLNSAMNTFEDDTVHWNVTGLTPPGTNPPPIYNGTAGYASTGAANQRLSWGQQNSSTNNFGDNKAIAVWTYVEAQVLNSSGPEIVYRASDIKVTGISKDGPAIAYAGAGLTFTVNIENEGNLNNTGDFAATFLFYVPEGTIINPADVVFASSTGATLNGTAAVYDIPAADVTAYSIKVNMPGDSNGTFVIPVTASNTLVGTRFNAWATIVRAKDTYDPNATNPLVTVTVPEDPFFEANGVRTAIASLNLNADFNSNAQFTNLKNSIDGTIPTNNPNYTNNIRISSSGLRFDICAKPGDFSTGGAPTKIGISTQKVKPEGWPENVPNGHILLESKEKGFVITRVANEGAIANPREGMLIYDEAEHCVKLHNGTSWHCITRDCNE